MMAVSINEMQVEVQDTPAPANTPPAESKTDKQVDLRSAMEMFRERELRLRAD
jgi:hypothetical protein